MKYNLTWIMRRAWSLHRREPRWQEKGFTLATALRLAWREAKGEKGYAFHLDNARASITAYLIRLADAIHDIHDEHKYSILRDCLLAPVDSMGVAVLTGKEVGLCKYAVRNV